MVTRGPYNIQNPPKLRKHPHQFDKTHAASKHRNMLQKAQQEMDLGILKSDGPGWDTFLFCSLLSPHKYDYTHIYEKT